MFTELLFPPSLCVTHAKAVQPPSRFQTAKLLCRIQNKGDQTELFFHHPRYRLKKPGGRAPHHHHNPSYQGSADSETRVSFSQGPISGPLSVCQLPASARDRRRGRDAKARRNEISYWDVAQSLLTLRDLPASRRLAKVLVLSLPFPTQCLIRHSTGSRQSEPEWVKA